MPMIEPNQPPAYSFEAARKNIIAAGPQPRPLRSRYAGSQYEEYERRVAAAQALMKPGRFSGVAYCDEVGTLVRRYARRQPVRLVENLHLVQRELDATATMLWG